jgi:hypothetical protein
MKRMGTWMAAEMKRMRAEMKRMRAEMKDGS